MSWSINSAATFLLFFCAVACAGLALGGKPPPATDSIVVNEAPPYHQGQNVTFSATYGAYATHQISMKQWGDSPYWIYTYRQNPFVWCTCYDSNPSSAYYNATVADGRLSFYAQEQRISSGFSSVSAPFLLSGTNDEYGPDPWPAADSANCVAHLVYAAKTPDGVEIFTIAEVSFSVVP